jgi:hypothetical protein
MSVKVTNEDQSGCQILISGHGLPPLITFHKLANSHYLMYPNNFIVENEVTPVWGIYLPQCKIRGFHSGVYESWCPLGCYAMCHPNEGGPKFLRNVGS